MLCTELERLESELIRVRTAQRNPSLTEVQREALVSAEVEMIMAIKDHQSCGHDGGACFGE